MPQPIVSVVLTSYNHASFLSEAIESVLNQTYGLFELIIWDDCSNDESANVVKRYSDPRIQFFKNPINEGPTHIFNKAIFEHCVGKFIAIHHSDDAWLPDKLKLQVDYLENNPNTGAVFSYADAINEQGDALPEGSHFYTNIFRQSNRSRHDWLRHFLQHGNALCHPSILIRKSCYQKVGGYRHDLFQLPDFEMWIRLCSYFDIHVIEEPLLLFRVLDGERNSSGNRPDTRLRAMFERMRIMETFENNLTVGDLRKMFPEITRLIGIPDNAVDIGLAAIIFEIQPFPSAQLYALKKVTSYLQNDSSAQLKVDADSESWPRLQDLYNLSGQLDAFGLQAQDQLSIAQMQISDFKLKIMMLAEDNLKIKQSSSWRVTAPLRATAGLLRRIKQ